MVSTDSYANTFATVGMYDSTDQVNTVDKDAAFDPMHSTGEGKNPTLVFGVREFTPVILSAYSNGCGGIVNFDNGIIKTGQKNDRFTANFGEKKLYIQSVDDIRTDFETNTRTPISGPGDLPGSGFLAKSDKKGDVVTRGGSYDFTFTEIGFASNEHVRAVAGTILGRDRSSADGAWMMQVKLDNGDTISVLASVNSNLGKGTDDTFYGACAPAGRYITGVSWTSRFGVYSGLDDFAFITSTSGVEIGAPAPDFETVGVYDAAGQDNSVDKDAAFDPDHSTGEGSNAELVFGVKEFSPEILSAYSNGCGGIVNFDNGIIKTGQQNDRFTASFGEKKLWIQSVDDIRTDFMTDNRTPVSGPGDFLGSGFLGKSDVEGDVVTRGGSYDFTFTEIGFAANEHVRAVAGTILGRDGSSPDGKWMMQVALDNGDTIAVLASVNSNSGNGNEDTFYGACAPAGRYITGVSWTSRFGVYSGLDDFAFITSTSDVEIGAPAPVSTLNANEASPTTIGGFSGLFGSDRPRRRATNAPTYKLIITN